MIVATLSLSMALGWRPAAGPPPELQDAQVTLALANTSYTDLCVELTKHTKTQFAVVTGIADRKLSVFCDARPISELEQAAEETLGLRFRYKDGKVEVTLDPGIARAEQEQLQTDQEHLLKALKLDLAYLAWFGRLDGSQRRQADDGAIPIPADYRLPEKARKALDVKVFELAPVAVAVAGSLDQYLQGFGRGTTYAFSCVKGDGLPPVDVMYAQPDPTVAESAPMTLRCLAKLDAGPENLRVWNLISTSANGGLVAFPTLLRIAPLPEPDAGPLGGKLSSWTEAPTGLTQPLPGKKNVPPCGYLGKALSLAEHLRALHEWTGVQFLADGYRLPVSRVRWCQAGTLGQYLDELRDGSREEPKIATDANLTPIAGYKSVAGWVCASHEAWWALQQREIPERLLRPLEHAFTEEGGVSLAQYADFVCSITPDQEFSLDEFMPYLAKFPLEPLRHMRAVLKFWSCLSDIQKESALHGGLALDRLVGEQRVSLVEALRSMVVISCPENLFAQLCSSHPALPAGGRLTTQDIGQPNIPDREPLFFDPVAHYNPITDRAPPGGFPPSTTIRLAFKFPGFEAVQADLTLRKDGVGKDRG